MCQGKKSVYTGRLLLLVVPRKVGSRAVLNHNHVLSADAWADSRAHAKRKRKQREADQLGSHLRVDPAARGVPVRLWKKVNRTGDW